MAHQPRGEKDVIGWTEYIDFPDWDVRGLKAKIDTGARTSALHVENIEELPFNYVKFQVVLDRKRESKRVWVTSKILKRAKVRSSSGHFTLRYFVQVKARIGHVVKPIDVSLVSREKMVFRMLLGRKALEQDFLVDVGKRAQLTKKPRKKIRKNSEPPTDAILLSEWAKAPRKKLRKQTAQKSRRLDEEE